MAKALLLYTDDVAAARDEIKLAGGRVTQQLTEKLLVATFADGFDETTLKLSSTALPASMDPQSQELAEAWQLYVAEKAADAQTSMEEEAWAKSHRPRNDDRATFEPDEQLPQNNMLTNKVVVGVVIVSGPSADNLRFTPDERAKIKAQVIAGLQFLADWQPAAQIDFVHEHRFVTIDATPLDEACPANNFEVCEKVWRNPAVGKLGDYPENLQGCKDYVKHLNCTHEYPGNAYVVFFTKYPQSWFAYALGGFRICMQFPKLNKNKIWALFAHETGHIFGAADEYDDEDGTRDCRCDKGYGYYDVLNGNCENCAENFVPCLMYENSDSICSFSEGQLGWLPQNGLFVFHQGEESNQLSYSVLDNNENWWRDRLVSNASISTTNPPSTTMYGGKLYCFYQSGTGKTNQLLYKVFDGANWGDNVKVQHHPLTYGPAVIEYQDTIYCFYFDVSDFALKYITSGDMSTWSEPQPAIRGLNIQQKISLIIFNGILYCCFRTINNVQGYIGLLSLNNSEFSYTETLQPTTAGQSLVEFGSPPQMYCFFALNDTLQYIATSDGINWSNPPNTFTNQPLTFGPSAAVFNQQLYCFYGGSSETGTNQLWYNMSSDGVSWSGPFQVLNNDAILPNVVALSAPSAIAAAFVAPEKAVMTRRQRPVSDRSA